MTETSHSRSRRVSLGGLVVQVVAFLGVLFLAQYTQSYAMVNVAWYLLGGVPIWFIALLVFRQRELAALEAMDLEELRREKQTAGGAALFEEAEGAGPGFRVAEARLGWMEKWLVPTFSLLTAVYLAAIGAWLWSGLATSDLTISGPGWPTLRGVPVAMVIIFILAAGTYLLSRFTSGMGRRAEWQLLRGCGAYLLGNSITLVALLVCLGVYQYAEATSWLHGLAYVVPIVMLVLAVEIGINFVLDVYRPRTAGVEPRAAFDSRLLGLFAEPGGIASSIADAINYQFGFQVSQTWFYQLLQRAFAPLVLTGAVALWLLTCIVIVQPYEHVIIERWGRQLNPGGETPMGEPRPEPYGPGWHFKMPWPMDVARVYNTGQLHQLYVGFDQFDAQPKMGGHGDGRDQVLLWTDERHFGLEHFDFVVHPTEESDARGEGLGPDGPALEERDDAAVHMIRMEVVVQYRIRPGGLHRFTRVMENPHQTVVDISWEEVTAYGASRTVDYLMSTGLERSGEVLRRQIQRRVDALGLEIVYVGIANIHPEKSVAEAFRNVIKAEQEKTAAIREARVTENQTLSRVAGDAELARGLALAINKIRNASGRQNEVQRRLEARDGAAIQELRGKVAALAALFRDVVAAEAQLEKRRTRLRVLRQDFELGLGSTLRQQEQAEVAVAEAELALERARAALERALTPIEAELETELGGDLAQVVVDDVRTQVTYDWWQGYLEENFTVGKLEGEAATKLAAALAERWQIEMDAARELVRTENEREAYQAAPSVYKVRRLMEVLVEGTRDARKFFLAFHPEGRTVRTRFVVEDEPQTDIIELSPDRPME